MKRLEEIHRKFRGWGLALFLVAGVLVTSLGLTACSAKESYQEPVPTRLSGKELNQKLETFGSGDYGMVYLAMYPIDTVREEDISYCFGCSHYCSDHEIANLKEMERYLEVIAEGIPSLDLLYLGIRPEFLDISELLASEAYQKALAAHPDMRVLFTLAYPSVDYWTGISDKRCEEVLAAYESGLKTLGESGVEAYYFGSSRWVAGNPALYEKEFCATEEMSYPMIGMMVPDFPYGVTSWNAQTFADELRNLVAMYRAGVTYPDLTDRKVVVFGDSIFGNYRLCTGIARVLETNTGAEVYNLAVGGMSCAENEATYPDFLEQVALLQGTAPQGFQPPDSAKAEYEGAREMLQGSGGEDVVFVIEFGLNDAMAALPLGTVDSVDPATTLGSLRLGIQALQEAYPQAKILVLAPGILADRDPETGDWILSLENIADYRNGILETAEACGADFVNMGTESDITPDNFRYYVNDGIHYNERGRFQLGVKLGEWISGL